MTKTSRVLQENRLGGTPSIGMVHERIHRGEFFTGGFFNQAVADNASLEILIQVAASVSMHALFVARVGGDAIARFYEDSTFSGQGDDMLVSNRNRFSANLGTKASPVSVLTTTPTGIVPGTLLAEEFLPGGTGFITGGNTVPAFQEWVLQTGKVYYGQLENVSGVANPMNIEIEFYEPESGGF